MSYRQNTIVDERRNWTRYCKERDCDFAVIMHPDCGEILAEVHDECLAGIGMLLDDLDGFDLGQEVDIVYAGELMQSIVRHIEPHADEGYLVGFECRRIDQ